VLKGDSRGKKPREEYTGDYHNNWKLFLYFLEKPYESMF
jgi:hypothetical protein